MVMIVTSEKTQNAPLPKSYTKVLVRLHMNAHPDLRGIFYAGSSVNWRMAAPGDRECFVTKGKLFMDPALFVSLKHATA